MPPFKKKSKKTKKPKSTLIALSPSPCLACEGTGKATSGSRCIPCNGTGREDGNRWRK